MQHRADAKQQQAEYERQTKHVNDLQLRLQEVTRRRDASKANVDEWLKKVKDAEDKEKDLTASVDLLNKQLAAVDMKPFSPNWILNQPMIDFISPTLKIDQVVLPDLPIDMNYMNVPRVDRCQTCHRAIDRPGWESKAEAARLARTFSRSSTPSRSRPRSARKRKTTSRSLKRVQDAPNEVLNPWRTHPKLGSLRRLGIEAPAASSTAALFVTAARTGHGIRPRRDTHQPA